MKAFRAVHRDPLLKARTGLRSCVNTEGLQAVEFGQRLKRTPTIIDKLRRLPTMKLSSMQDIGGCRAVFSAQSEVERVLARFTRNSLKRNEIEDAVRDYVTNPRSSGYRGVHIWTRYDGRRLEVQLRTELQHGWAKLVEELVVLTGVDYKSGDGPEIVHEWLRRLSGVCASVEAGQSIASAYGPGYAEIHKAAWDRIQSDVTRHRGGVHG